MESDERLGPPPVTVLLVEDDAAVRAVARCMLLRMGYTVLEACDGDEAALVYQRLGGPIDLLLTDLRMPNRNGRELAEHLTLVQPGLRVLFMTGFTEDPLLCAGHRDGSLAVLPKPFRVDDLVRKVREVLR